MIGGSGSYSLLHYANNSQTVGVTNGNTTEALAFYSRRMARSEYLGVAYQFSKFITHPIATYTVTDSTFGFYTHYFTRSFLILGFGRSGALRRLESHRSEAGSLDAGGAGQLSGGKHFERP